MDTVRDKIFEVKSKLKAEEPENDANELKELQQILARNRNNKKYILLQFIFLIKTC